MGVGGGRRGGEVGEKKGKVLKIGTWNKGGATQDLWKKINEIEIILKEQNFDCLGITEANLKTNAVMEKVSIEGYTSICDSGIKHQVKQNSRVVAFVKEELSYEVVNRYMGEDMMPEIWIRLGHKGTKRTLVGFIYREHKPWRLGDASIGSQEQRWKLWIEARRPIWQGTQETYMMGDINIDWSKKEDKKYRNVKMLKKLEVELSDLGWAQLVKSNTHYTNANGVISESLIDHVWTNSPLKVKMCGQEKKRASDHQLVWIERSTKNLVEKVKKTEKRTMRTFRIEDLELLCQQEDWSYRGSTLPSEKVLDDRVRVLERKITNILEKVAPMEIKKVANKGKPRWITKELEILMKERKLTDRKARSTKNFEDELESRRVRNIAAKEIKHAKTEYLKVKLKNLSSNSTKAWDAVNTYLGWRKPMSPTQLIQDGNVLTQGPELAEAMLKQYEKKDREVQDALGEANGDYLAASRRLTSGNRGVFTWKKITKKEVEEKIADVDNKESFGDDGISYAFLKRMSRWISQEMMEIMNLSLEIRTYPASWRIARLKPLFKGEGCERTDPKSFRPVALLSAISRVMEGILAKQLDQYQENHGLVHQGVHGFRKGRGTNTAMLEVWEYVLRRTEKGEMVALNFLDVSDGFGSLVHINLLRKMEVQYGMDQDSLEWLASYVGDWEQYVVVEAARSRARKTTRGTPQGGGLSPILWRSATNDVPEAGLVQNLGPGHQLLHQELEEDQTTHTAEEGQAQKDVVSERIDKKNFEDLTTEERLDQKFRGDGTWKLEVWKRERTGLGAGERDSFKQKVMEDPEDVITTIYADDTQSRAASKDLKDLERRNSQGITKVCNELKALRLKVNEGKTVYMVLSTPGIRRRDGLVKSEIKVCGKNVKNVNKGKALGLVVSDDLSWRDNAEKVAKSCTTKLSGLWRCTEVLGQEERKTKVECIILSRLYYCLETTSTGIKNNMERLQGVQSSAARWVLQIKRKDWSLRGGLKRLGWLSVVQQAAYCSVKLAIQVLQQGSPERLFEAITEERDGQRVRKVLTEDALQRLKLSSMKSWSVRAVRWMDMMSQDMLTMDTTTKLAKKQLKQFIKHRVGVRGDKVFWGKPLKDGRQGTEQELGGGQGGDGGRGQEGREPQERELENNPPAGGGQGEETPPGRRPENRALGGGHEDKTPNIRSLGNRRQLQKGVGEKIASGGGEEQRSLPKTLLGLSAGTESGRAGPLTKPGKEWGKYLRMKEVETDKDRTVGAAAFNNILFHVHPDELRLWLQGDGQGDRLYLRKGLWQQPQCLQHRTGVG